MARLVPTIRPNSSWRFSKFLAAAPLPVRDVRRLLHEKAGRTLTHSSVITILNIMVRKGYLRRHKQGNAFFFSPKVEKNKVSGGLVGDLGKGFDGWRPRWC